MAPKKAKVPASWNAKPVTQRGGGSGGVRKPTKPYAKPPAKPAAEKPARWDAKTKIERLQDAARTKPSSPAPRPAPKPTGAVGARPMGTADVGPKGPVGRLGQRTGMSGNPPAAKPPAKPTPKPSGNNPYMAAKPNANAALTGVKGVLNTARGAGRLLGPAGTAAAIVPTATSVFNPKDNIITRLGKLGDSIERAVTPSGRTPKPTKPSKPSKPAARVADYKDAQGNTYDGNTGRLKSAAPARPQRPSVRQSSGGNGGNGGGQTRSSGGSSAPATPRSSAPRSTTPSTSSNAGMKNQDKNYRGNVFEKTFGYKRGEAPDQVKSKPSSFDTKSDTYTPTTKVDGSKLNAMKIDQKKVDEYKRRKDRYYS